jgi:hypothetical protein
VNDSSTVQASATASNSQANPPGATVNPATTTTHQDEYTNATSGTPALYDSLTHNSKTYGWNVSSGMCKFTAGALHATRTTSGATSCDATSNFTNFAFQVQMTIISGNTGGIDFRSNSNGGYFFFIDQDGSYTFYLGANSSLHTLGNGFSTAFHTGLNQTNLITVVVRNSTSDFYVNSQYVTTLTDSTYSQGLVGVDADYITSSTEVAFNNAKVWAL